MKSAGGKSSNVTRGGPKFIVSQVYCRWSTRQLWSKPSLFRGKSQVPGNQNQGPDPSPRSWASSVFFHHSLFNKARPLTERRAHPFWLVWPASMAHGFQMSASRVLGLQAAAVLPSFFVGYGDSSPHTLTASTSSSDPFPKSPFSCHVT